MKGKLNKQKPRRKINPKIVATVLVLVVISGVLYWHFGNTISQSVADTYETVKNASSINPRSDSRLTTITPPTEIASNKFRWPNCNIYSRDEINKVLSKINNARDAKTYTVVELGDVLCSKAEEINRFVSQFYDENKPSHYLPSWQLPYHESYFGSIFIMDRIADEKSSQIITIDNFTCCWVGNERENYKMTYPFLRTVGMSVIDYGDYIIGVFLSYKDDIKITDRRNVRLLPIYHELTNNCCLKR